MNKKTTKIMAIVFILLMLGASLAGIISYFIN